MHAQSPWALAAVCAKATDADARFQGEDAIFKGPSPDLE
jgi:hypothetical protein